MSTRRYVALALVTMMLHCGDDGASGAGGATSPSNGGTGASGGTVECPTGYHPWEHAGVRYVPEEDCVDVRADEVLFFEMCRSDDEDANTEGARFYCFRRLEDGAEYWLNNIYIPLLPLSPTWEWCDGAPTDVQVPPRPCFAVCPDTEIGYEEPLSTCTEGATRILYGCGLDTKWDENCCRRKYCSDLSPCPDGFECRLITQVTPDSYCWVGIGPDADPETVDLDDPAQGCSCVGAVNPPNTYCFPIE